MEPGADLTYVGDFSSIRETDGHVYGYTLQLWKDGHKVVALWSKADGQPADFPTVLADDVSWDEQSGRIHFTVQWCGSTSRFEGTLTAGSVSGRLAAMNITAAPMALTLKRTDDEWPITTREDWQLQIQQILKRRHPRC
jgi:hypothetical protein